MERTHLPGALNLHKDSHSMRNELLVDMYLGRLQCDRVWIQKDLTGQNSKAESNKSI